MALDKQQLAVARQIMALAIARGVSPARARELAAAAYSESGLRPGAVNSKSGAAGLFQLLSSGYRTRAQQLGGLHDIKANTLAILPSYKKYWAQHPNAAPGEAGRDVERSGMGADFYSKGLPMMPDGSVVPVPPRIAAMMERHSAPPEVPAASGIDPIRQTALSGLQAIAQGRYDPLEQLSTLQEAREASQALPEPQRGVYHSPERTPAAPQGHNVRPEAVGGLAEAFYDPLGSFDNGKFGGPIGGHSDHVHLSITNPHTMIAAITKAQELGLRVGENPYVDKVDPVHVKGSFHYRDFPGKYKGRTLGEAIDVSGDPEAMAAFYRWTTTALRGGQK